MSRSITALALALLLLGGCGGEVAFEDRTASSAAASEHRPDGRDPNAIWFEVLAVSTRGRDIGDIGLATSAVDLARMWQHHGFDGSPPEVRFDEQVVLVVVRPEDGCPDDLVAAEVVEGTLETTFLPPPGGCIEPLIPTAYAVALHRADLPEELTIRLAAHEAHGGDRTATFTLPPHDGPGAPDPSPPPRQMDPAELDAVFADHPVRRCDDVPDPRRAALGGGPSAVQREHPEVPGDIQQRYAAEHRDTYGWVMLDSTRGELAVGVTDDVQGHRRRLAERHPDVPLRVEQTPHTEQALAAAQQAVQPYLGADRGPQLSSASYFAFLELGVINPTREDLDGITEVVDPALVCVEPILSGLEPAPAS